MFYLGPQPPPTTSVSKEIRSKLTALYQECVDKMLASDTTHDYSYPVTDSIAPHYSSIVAHPMDLNTMRKRCVTYTSMRELRQDIDTILSNCRLYNGDTAPITLQAQTLHKKWREILLARQNQENELQRELESAKVKEVKVEPLDRSTVQSILNLSVLILAIAFETATYRSQLFRAITQRLLFLLENNKPPVDNGILDVVLFQYSQLLVLATQLPKIVESVRGKSSFFPEELLAKKPTSTGSEQHRVVFALLFQEFLVNAAGADEEDRSPVRKDLMEHSQDLETRELLYCSICGQLPMMESPESSEALIIGDILKIVAQYDLTCIKQDWHWIQTVSLSLVLREVEEVRLSNE